ncbi:RNA 2',3'-cyclic phosphodiesterase [bacterium]|nr:RNA 2',3'-cyclic phosphodiesterase [bacterium]
MNQTIRTFIAVPVPDSVSGSIASFASPLKRLDADVKWVRPESLHLTLKFLGDVETVRIPAVGDAMAEAVSESRAFTLQLGGSGFFPNASRPAVIWIGVTKGAGDLTHLAEAVDAAAVRCGFGAESRPFAAHLTIGRVRSPRGIDRLVTALSGSRYESAPFSARTILIMKSDLQRTGAVHTPYRTIQLKD